MGSGSMGVACKTLNRKFIGIELNKEHFDVAEKRLIK
jgi:site-specific DNA-methyltransferase (adenine-specific)